MLYTVRKESSITPLLFQKRVSVAGSVSAQYIGTDMEMDPKESYIKPGASDLKLEEV